MLELDSEMSALTTPSKAEGKVEFSDTRPRGLKFDDRDPIGCENEYEIKIGMPRSDAMVIAFRILWCGKIGAKRRKLRPLDIPKLVADLNRCVPDTGNGEVTVESLLQRIGLFRGQEYVRNMKEAILKSSQRTRACEIQREESLLTAAA